MDRAERILEERRFHDRQAAERAAAGVVLRFDDDAYLDHETWIRPALDRLGDVRGKRVMDFGCGHGMAAVVLARRGADVTAFDLSAGYVDEARTRADANDVHINFLQADGERLPFADGSFDAIWGNAILHHLDIAVAGRELHRVLAPNGIAVFCEPWGDNWLLNAARNHVGYAEKDRTRDERPLTSKELVTLGKFFPDIDARGFQLLSMTRRVFRSRKLMAGLDWCDDLLLRRVPGLQRYCRYMVITLRKSSFRPPLTQGGSGG